MMRLNFEITNLLKKQTNRQKDEIKKFFKVRKENTKTEKIEKERDCRWEKAR